MERTAKAVEQEFETYRFTNIKFAGNSNEGHVAVNFDVRPVKEKMLIPAGSYWVPMKQRRGRLRWPCWNRRRRIRWRAGV